MAKQSKRKIRLNQHALIPIIKAQAGSLEKAVMEGISNSVDAGASEISVSVESNRVIIKDNGKGMPSKKDIENFFEDFGFDHSQEDTSRGIGRFGIGRGQLFCFGVNRWRTGPFEMVVDIEKMGIGDYDFVEGLPHQPGMEIVLDLYEPLSNQSLYNFRSKMKEAVRFLPIPVKLNDELISKSPEKEKWDDETDEAWFRFSDQGRLKVYSQGVYVTELSAYQHGGIAGTVVTKPGKALMQNMARNDILTQKCPVWKKILPVLKEHASKGIAKNKAKRRLTEHQIKHRLIEGMSGGLPLKELLNERLLPLSNGKMISIHQLLDGSAQGLLIGLAQAGDLGADRAMQFKQALLLDREKLSDWLGIDDIKDFRENLKRAWVLGALKRNHCKDDESTQQKVMEEMNVLALKALDVKNTHFNHEYAIYQSFLPFLKEGFTGHQMSYYSDEYYDAKKLFNPSIVWHNSPEEMGLENMVKVDFIHQKDWSEKEVAFLETLGGQSWDLGKIIARALVEQEGLVPDSCKNHRSS